jgi:hypothetical protein
MPDKRAQAEALVAASPEGQGLSADHREVIVGALSEDLRNASGQRRAASTRATLVEERLAKLETELKLLQAAVLAIYRYDPTRG